MLGLHKGVPSATMDDTPGVERSAAIRNSFSHTPPGPKAQIKVSAAPPSGGSRN